ncbi:sigma-54 dependent transcriptional regulator [Aromatoleum toluolicum]|uniref:Response regulator n=1 Tax=Aromatoleum toluolicum TaxID=90060 RepID=A0ABX1NAS6_9RHOO|nr:sigma-54 dependent transcriptional regulator [Aromatoleum toluolicum]NMF96323.1 sigma-54 dependent transcriptional regulator [Aromatoleum toluolicum]
MNAAVRVCLVEDDPIMGESLCERFRLEGFDAHWCTSGAEAMRSLREQAFDVVISDMRLGDTTGEAIFDWAAGALPQAPPFVFITGYGTVDQAVALIKRGACDYVTKPFDLDALVARVLEIASAVRAQDEGAPGLEPLGVSAAMQRIEAMLPRLARAASTVLIVGESGVGKERVAQRLHACLPDAARRPFVALNCGAVPETLLEPELFGHEKGAFTGAARSRAGVFEQAHGGTLFLDEIGEMTLAMQVRLLRAVQERQVVRVGGERPIPVDLLLVCATHRDLKAMVAEGTFREDLFYRVNVVQIRVPPLRERREDIPWLIRRFLSDIARQSGEPRRHLVPAAEEAALAYPWPGNVRELKHAVERACIMSPAEWITPAALFPDAEVAPTAGDVQAPLGDYLRECECRYIRGALESCDGHIGRTADLLGISRKNLWEKMKKLDIGHA